MPFVNCETNYLLRKAQIQYAILCNIVSNSAMHACKHTENAARIGFDIITMHNVTFIIPP